MSTTKVKTSGNIVSAPVAGGAYPKSHKGACLWHAVELSERGSPVRVLCKRVSLDSILDDGAMYNTKPVDCPQCARALLKASNPSARAIKRRVDILHHIHSGRTGSAVRHTARERYDAQWLGDVASYVMLVRSDGISKMLDRDVADGMTWAEVRTQSNSVPKRLRSAMQTAGIKVIHQGSAKARSIAYTL